MIEYRGDLDGLTEASLEGFFVGWPTPPSPMKHLEILRNSYAIVLATDPNTKTCSRRSSWSTCQA